MQRSVSIVVEGRSGRVVYRDEGGSLVGSWEFGGNDVTTIVSMGSATEWQTHHPWAVARRSEILRFVADEVCRQKSPRDRAEVDETTGTILLRSSGAGRHAGPPHRADGGEPPNAWYYRYTRLKLRFAMFVAVGALVVGGLVWLKDKMFRIDPGKGTPIGLCVRTDVHVATWIQTLEAYVPSLHRDGSADRFTLSVLLVPLDGSPPAVVPVHRGLTATAGSLAKILGSDGRSLWVDGNGVRRIDLTDLSVHEPDQPPPGGLLGATKSRLPQEPQQFLARGCFPGAGAWVGVLSATERAGDYAIGRFVRRGATVGTTKEPRGLFKARVEPDTTGRFQQLASLEPLGEREFLDAGVLRADTESDAELLRDPDSVLVVHRSDSGIRATLVLTRVDLTGNVLWTADTGIDRFTTQQLLPGSASTVIVGTRPREPDRVPEPILAIVDSATGRVTVQSLWR